MIAARIRVWAVVFLECLLHRSAFDILGVCMDIFLGITIPLLIGGVFFVYAEWIGKLFCKLGKLNGALALSV